MVRMYVIMAMHFHCERIEYVKISCDSRHAYRKLIHYNPTLNLECFRIMSNFTGILPSEIEVGRFRGVSLDDRICQNCNMGAVESEVYSICECRL